MSLIERLNQLNDIKIYSVNDEKFKSYGRVVTGYNFNEAIKYMEYQTHVPKEGNIYVASEPNLEDLSVFKNVKKIFYGDMPIQVGYCNGRNSTYNGFEYHKCSEINIAITDFLISLGHVYDIKDNHYDNNDAQVFFVPKGTAVELYQTTLHLSPLKCSDNGFKNIVVLAKGTNTPLNEKVTNDDIESRLLLQKNKWVISHPDREPLIKQGAYPGIIGENKEIYYN